MFAYPLSALLLHFINGSATATPSGAIHIDTDIPMSPFATLKGLAVAGLTQLVPKTVFDDVELFMPVSCLLSEVACINPSNGLSWLVPSEDVSGIIYVELADTVAPIKTGQCKHIRYTDYLRLIFWYNSCHFGFEQNCCPLYQWLIGYVMSKIPCHQSMTLAAVEMADINCGGGMTIGDLSIDAYKQETVARAIFAKNYYSKLSEGKYLDVAPYEAFAITFKVSYTVPISCFVMPELEEPSKCLCLLKQ